MNTFSAPRVSNRISSFLFLITTLFFGERAVCQNVTQSNFTGVITPQYMTHASNLNRLPVMFRATVSGLAANTTYRYFVRAVTNSNLNGATIDFGTPESGVGVCLLVSSDGTTYTYTGSPSLTTAGLFETFTTNADGTYTGWFGFQTQQNTRFTAGNTVFPCITISNTSGTTLFRLALDLGITPLRFPASPASFNGSFLRIASNGTAKNLACLYDNVLGSGRPIFISPIGDIGAVMTNNVPGYLTGSGDINAIIPNTNANGIRRIEQRSVLSGDIVGCTPTDANGQWPTGSIQTASPSNGPTPIDISATDANFSVTAGLHTSFTQATNHISPTNNPVYGSDCRLIANITSSGVSPQILGSATTQVWVEANQLTNAQGRPFVKRHYEITPAINPNTATATVTLYFLQSEFDDFNDFNPSGPDMPSGPSDGLGISNLRIYKIAGSSSPNDGLPANYAGAGSFIDPADANIVWNATESRWEITFDVVGFSGFFVTNANFTILPLSAMVLQASQQNGMALLNWTTAKADVASYELQRSMDGRQFATVYNVLGNGNQTQFAHSEAWSANMAVYYRVMATDRNGSKRISNVALLKSANAASAISVYPNPVKKGEKQLQVSVNNNAILGLRLVTAAGVTLVQKSGLNIVGATTLNLPSTILPGIYFLHFETSTGHQVQRVVVE